MSELKPCPFCGGLCDVSGWMDLDANQGPECETCGATAGSVDAWNSRTPQGESVSDQDKHAIITNHLNVLTECIKSVPVPERDREANIKMRDAILNVMARSVVAYQVEPADLKNEAGEALRQAIQAKQLTSASSMRLVCMLSL